MSFTQSVRTCFRKYAVFRGRAVRSEFWWFFLFVMASTTLMSFAPSFLGLLHVLALLLPTLAVMVRRLHDLNQSGWRAPAWFVPILGWLLLIWLAFPGTVGPNRFGLDPKQQEWDDWWQPPSRTETGPPTSIAGIDGEPSPDRQAVAICPQCGAALHGDSRFCSQCGSPN